MIFRFLRGALRLHPLRLALIVLSAAMGSSIAASLFAVSLQVNEKIAAEMRSFGANIILEPEVQSSLADVNSAQGYLNESDISSVLTVFWRNNIVGLTPTLTAPVEVRGQAKTERALLAGFWFDRQIPRPGVDETLRAGVVSLFPYWEIEGEWPREESGSQAVVGRALAERLGIHAGDTVTIAAGEKTISPQVTGLLHTGGFEEDEILVNLETAQEFLDRPGRISSLMVSVVTVPLDAFGRRNPETMTRVELEKWICTAYITSVARQFENAMPGSRARLLWSMAEAEARVLSRLNVLMILLAVCSMAAGMLAVSSTFTARIMGRRSEIALMRAGGAAAGQIVVLLEAEIMAMGLAGGVIGSFMALFMIRGLGMVVFNAPIDPSPMVFPIAILCALVVAAAGSVWPISRALAADPAAALKEVV